MATPPEGVVFESVVREPTSSDTHTEFDVESGTTACEAVIVKPRCFILRYLDKIAAFIRSFVPDIEQRVFVHLICHAQAEHNVKGFSKQQDKAFGHLRDPGLTPIGFAQCAYLSRDFEFMTKITHVLVSPLRRSLETYFATFYPFMRTEIPTILWPGIKEWGNDSVNLGTSLDILQPLLADKQVNLSLLEPGWENVVERETRRIRGQLSREELVQFADAARDGTEWNGIPLQDALVTDKNDDIHILLLSHDIIMCSMIALEGEPMLSHFENTGVRTFEVLRKSKPGKRFKGLWRQKEGEVLRRVPVAMQTNPDFTVAGYPKHHPEPFIYKGIEAARMRNVSNMFR